MAYGKKEEKMVRTVIKKKKCDERHHEYLCNYAFVKCPLY